MSDTTQSLDSPNLGDPKHSPNSIKTEVIAHDVGSGESFHNSTMEKRILRKIDLHLIVPLWIMFLCCFLDRINIGFVAVLGMIKDLQLFGNKFNVSLQVYFVTYILCDIPTNLLMKHVRPSWLIPGTCFFWGVMALCQGITKSYGGLIVCRLLLGAFEGGFMPAAIWLLSTYYKRHELQFRFNIWWSAAILAGAVGGLLAYAINNMDGVGGYQGWRWVLIFEGLIAAVVAVGAFFFLADWPHQAHFLSVEERAFWIKRTKLDAGVTGSMERLDRKAVMRIVSDWKIWLGSVMYFCSSTSGYATSLFIPSILTSMGYSGVQAQVRSIPIWIVTAVLALATGLSSDAVKHRFGFIVAGLCVSLPGYIILLCQGPADAGLPHGVRYMALFFITVGTHMVQPTSLVWVTVNLGGAYKRSVGPAMLGIAGSIGGIVASNVFLAKDEPRYFVGYGIVMGLVVLGGFCAGLFALGLTIENRKRDRGERDYRLQLSPEELQNMGDDHPSFRFSL